VDICTTDIPITNSGGGSGAGPRQGAPLEAITTGIEKIFRDFASVALAAFFHIILVLG
jgi:hypothetical protein